MFVFMTGEAALLMICFCVSSLGWNDRYESLLAGLHSNERLIACDVSSISAHSHDVEVCKNRMCLLDVSQTCSER